MKKIFWRNNGWIDEPLSKCEAALDIGAGGIRRAKNVVTMDIRKMINTDVVHNANQTPWPFGDNAFDYIILSNVLEHVDDIYKTLDEIRRVAKPHAIVRCICPHFTNPCSYVDVTHTRALSVLSLDTFCIYERNRNLQAYQLIKKILGCDMGVDHKFRENKFRLLRRSIYFREATWWTLIPIWGNFFQEFYEVYISRLIPGWAVYWELQVIKS